MKLDAGVLRYMSKDEFRVLVSVEMGMRNHALVPTALLPRIANMSSALTHKMLKLLHKNKLIYHEAVKYDGYRLTYSGYDYLALYALLQRGLISSLGHRIGVGKEADIYAVGNEVGEKMVLKIHRLGRISFRRIVEKRDYHQHRSATSWLYLSRLAAQREYAYLTALHQYGFPVPTPIDQSRHIILMSYVDAIPLSEQHNSSNSCGPYRTCLHPDGHLRELSHVGRVYSQLMNLILRLAEHGLIHCDFNEFNLMIDSDEELTLIDFPQMVSVDHANAADYFARDVNCIRTYFQKRFGFTEGEYPQFHRDVAVKVHIDQRVRASGSKKQQKTEREQHQGGTEDMIDNDSQQQARLDEHETEFEQIMHTYNQADQNQRSQWEQEHDEEEEDGEPGQHDHNDDDDDDCYDEEEEEEEERPQDQEYEQQQKFEEAGQEEQNGSNEQEDEADDSTRTGESAAAHRARMLRRDARQQNERARQERRRQRREGNTTEETKEDDDESSTPPPLHNQSVHQQPLQQEPTAEELSEDDHDSTSTAESVSQSDNALLLSSIKSKLSRARQKQQAGVLKHKGRNVAKNRKQLKLRAEIDAHV